MQDLSRRRSGSRPGPLRPLKWFEVPVAASGVIPVMLATQSICDEISGCNGATVMFPTSQIIVFIDCEPPRAAQDERLFHELLVHGVLWPFACDGKTEEDFAQKQSPGAWQTLRSLGFRWPRRPRGARALEEAARG